LKTVTPGSATLEDRDGQDWVVHSRASTILNLRDIGGALVQALPDAGGGMIKETRNRGTRGRRCRKLVKSETTRMRKWARTYPQEGSFRSKIWLRVG